MLYKEYKISEIIDTSAQGTTTYSAIILGDNDVTVTVSQDMIENAFMSYTEWTVETKTPETGGVMPITHPFKQLWDAYIKRRKRSYDRIAVALYTDYSPIDNYDKHSDITTKNPEVTTTNVIASRTDSSTLGTRTTHNKETAYNDLTPKEAEQIIQDGVTDSATRGGGTDTSTISSHNVEVTEYTHGNIGVEKSSNIAKEEINFRLAYDLAAIIVADFITEYCYLI